MIHCHVHKVIWTLSSSLSCAKYDSIIRAHLECIIIATTTFQNKGSFRIYSHVAYDGLLESPSMIDVLLAHDTTMEGGFIGQLECCLPGNKARQKGV